VNGQPRRRALPLVAPSRVLLWFCGISRQSFPLTNGPTAVK
jgi:hypothetical protein